MLLRFPRSTAIFNVPNGFDQQLCPHLFEPVIEFTGGFIGSDFRLFGIDNVAGIHLGCQIHRGNTGFLIAVQNRPLDRCSTAVLREEGPVYVDGAERRHGQQIVRENSAVGYYHNEVRLQTLQHGKCRSVAHLSRLKNRNIMGEGYGFHRRERNLHASSAGFIRLCKNAGHLISVLDQRFQRRRSEFRRTHKNNPHVISILRFEFLLPSASAQQVK